MATPDTNVLSPGLQGEWQLGEEVLLGAGGKGRESVESPNNTKVDGTCHHIQVSSFPPTAIKEPLASHPRSQAWSSAEVILQASPPEMSFSLLHVSFPPAAVSQLKSHFLLPLPVTPNGRPPEGPGHLVLLLSKY